MSLFSELSDIEFHTQFDIFYVYSALYNPTSCLFRHQISLPVHVALDRFHSTYVHRRFINLSLNQKWSDLTWKGIDITLFTWLVISTCQEVFSKDAVCNGFILRIWIYTYLLDCSNYFLYIKQLKQCWTHYLNLKKENTLIKIFSKRPLYEFVQCVIRHWISYPIWHFLRLFCTV